MVANLFGYVDVGREIRVVTVGCKRIGIARFTYQIRKLRVFGFGGSERMHFVIQVEIGYRPDGCVGISVVDASFGSDITAFADFEGIFLALVFGDVLRTLH